MKSWRSVSHQVYSGVCPDPELNPLTRPKPTSLIEAKVDLPIKEYSGKIVEVKLGATRTEGGTRGKSIVIGGESVPAYYNFQQLPPHKPVIAFDVFDWPKVL